MTYYFKWDELESDTITPKYSTVRGPKVEGERILMGLFSHGAGESASRHSHPNEQITYIVKGRLRICIGDEEKTIGPGEVFVIPANTEHEVYEVLEDVESIVCKDIVSGWSLKDARWEK